MIAASARMGEILRKSLTIYVRKESDYDWRGSCEATLAPLIHVPPDLCAYRKE